MSERVQPQVKKEKRYYKYTNREGQHILVRSMRASTFLPPSAPQITMRGQPYMGWALLGLYFVLCYSHYSKYSSVCTSSVT